MYFFPELLWSHSNWKAPYNDCYSRLQHHQCTREWPLLCRFCEVSLRISTNPKTGAPWRGLFWGEVAKSARPRNFVGVSSRVFLTGETSPRSEILNFKNRKRIEFEGFQLLEVRENCQIRILGFHCVARNLEKWLKICNLFLICSQIWLNLPKDGHHFFYILLWTIAHFSYKQKLSIKKALITW